MNEEAETGERAGIWAYNVTKGAMSYGAIKILLCGLQTIGILLWFMTFLAHLGRVPALSSSFQSYLLCAPVSELPAPDRYSHTLSPFLHYSSAISVWWHLLLWGEKKKRGKKMCWYICLNSALQGPDFSGNFCLSWRGTVVSAEQTMQIFAEFWLSNNTLKSAS